MNEEFINTLLSKMTNEIAELNKTKYILLTQLEMKEKELQQMTELKNRLENANNAMQEASKTKKKE